MLPRNGLLRPVALFIDGMSRAVILSFGPSLVYRLVTGNGRPGPEGSKLGLDCSGVAWPLAIVVATFLFGRFCGTSLIASKLSISNTHLPKYVARLSGLAIALHVFTLGAGLTSVWWLVMIRFLSGLLVGILCHITRPLASSTSLNEDCYDLETGTVSSASSRIRTKQRDAYIVDFASGTTKIYMTAFAVSILSGGLLYRHATGDATFKTLTDSHRFSISPLFLIGVSILAEALLRSFFAFCGPRFSSTKGFSLLRRESSTGSSSPYEATRRRSRLNSYESTHSSYRGYSSPYKPRSRSGTATSEGFAPARDRIGSANSVTFSIPFDSAPSSRESSGGFRARIETAESAEFFDCNSVISDMDDFPLENDDPEQLGDFFPSTASEISRYIDGKCLYSNQTPAFVPAGDRVDTIPPNFLAICGGKRHKAQKLWENAQRWRHENDVWRIHSMPNTWFSQIKEAYPHTLHGFSKQGYPIIYEQPGKMNLKQLFRDGCDVEDMVRHYMFFMEFVSNKICTRPEIREKLGPNPPDHSSSTWGTMVVMDISGASITSLSTDVLSYLKRAGEINGSYYPMSMKRAFLVNSPFWLSGAWSTVKGILPESVTADILSTKKYPDALREYIDDDQIPPEYGGSSPYKLGEHPFEKELIQLVEDTKHLDVNPEPVDFASGYVGSRRNSYSERLNDVPDPSTSWDAQAPMSPPAPAVRRRAQSTEGSQLTNKFAIMESSSYHEDDDDDSYHGEKGDSSGGEYGIFVIVSAMYAFWGATQGIIETAIPFWILVPTTLGGLGYAPSRSGVALFCSLMMLLWVMRTKVSRVISKIPSKAPMRAFRIGAGAEACLLLLLATVPKTAIPEKRTDSIVVMTTTIIFISCAVISSILGRSSSTVLHRIACKSYADSNPKRRKINWLTTKYGGIGKLVADCESGRLTEYLSISGEVFGVLSVAPLFAWSLAHHRPAPFDGTGCLFLCALITFSLYVCSFSLHLNRLGEFAPHPRRESAGCSDGAQSQFRRCCAFLLEAATVSLGDIASLLEEANWSLSAPLLGHPIGGSGSDPKSPSKLIL